jgi:hypothetical protein
MALKNRTTLKGYFNTGDKPTESNFANFLDSVFIPGEDTIDWDDVDGKPSTFAPAAHNHAASEITSGTFAPARIGAGTPTDGLVLKLVLGVPTWSIESGGGGSGWGLSGNAITSAQFIGTTNNQPMVIKQNNEQVAKFEGLNTAIGRGCSATNYAACTLGIFATNTGHQSILFGRGNINGGTTNILISPYGGEINSVNFATNIGFLTRSQHDGTFIAWDGGDGSTYYSTAASNQWKTQFRGGFLFQTGTTLAPVTALEILSSGYLKIASATYADDAAAASLAANTVYKTATGELRIKL